MRDIPISYDQADYIILLSVVSTLDHIKAKSITEIVGAVEEAAGAAGLRERLIDADVTRLHEAAQRLRDELLLRADNLWHAAQDEIAEAEARHARRN